MTFEIDAVIVTADTREMTLECLRALAQEPRLGITVVDNGSADATEDAVRGEFGESVQVIRLEQPVGFASACNRGAEKGTAPFVLFLNSDILTAAGSIARLREALERDHGAVAAGGRLVDPEDLTTQPGYRPRRFPGLLSLAVIVTGVEGRWPQNPVTRHWRDVDLDESRTQRVSQPAAAALMVRRESLEAISGFDERFWFWFEDCDLLKRLSERGGILWVPSAPFRHLGGATFSRWSRLDRIRSQYQGILQYGASHLGAVERVLLGLLTIAGSLAWSVRLRPDQREERDAMRAVARAGSALVRGRRLPRIAGPQG